MGAFFNIPGIPATPRFAELVLKANITQSGGGTKPFFNVFHFWQPAPDPLAGVIDTLAFNFIDLIDANLSAALSIEYTNGKMTGRFMDDPTNAPGSPQGDIDGAVTGDRATSFNAATIRLLTSARGRNFRGSKHFGPLAESSTLLDRLTAGAQTLWNAVCADLDGLVATGIDGGNDTLWFPIVLSPTLSDLEANPSVFTFAPVTNYTLNVTVGSMRRRKEKSSVTA